MTAHEFVSPEQFRSLIAERIADHVALSDWVSATGFATPEPSSFNRTVYEVWVDDEAEFDRLAAVMVAAGGDLERSEIGKTRIVLRRFGSVHLELCWWGVGS